MSILRIHDGAAGDTVTLTLYVWATPDGSGNLCGGLYDYRYSHRTLNLRQGMSIDIALDDCTGLNLEFVDLLASFPSCVTLVPPEKAGSPATLRVENGLASNLLVFFSIVLQSTPPATPVVLFCDPQVGNDPKVSPT